MTPREFYDLVRRLRFMQKEFACIRNQEYLQKVKNLEKLVDDEIRRVDKILFDRSVKEMEERAEKDRKKRERRLSRCHIPSKVEFVQPKTD